jgi:phosphopantothenate---cysteine ligase (CTP)
MNVVVTGGGTIAPIDDVRAITNVSSGRFSAMITEACLARGATVWHVHAPLAQLPFQRLAQLDFEAANPAGETARLAQLRQDWLRSRARLHLVALTEATVSNYAARLEQVLRSQAIDLAFLAMAVSDFEPEPFPGKLDSHARETVIRCHPTRKVIQSVRDWNPRVYLVAFKLLSRVPQDALIREAENACRTNRADLTVANSLQSLQAGQHTVHLVRPGQTVRTIGPPEPIAERLVECVFQWTAERGGG